MTTLGSVESLSVRTARCVLSTGQLVPLLSSGWGRRRSADSDSRPASCADATIIPCAAPRVKHFRVEEQHRRLSSEDKETRRQGEEDLEARRLGDEAALLVPRPASGYPSARFAGSRRSRTTPPCGQSTGH